MNTGRTVFFSLLMILSIGLIVNGFAFKQTDILTQEKYSQVKIFALSESDFNEIENAGLHLDHVE